MSGGSDIHSAPLMESSALPPMRRGYTKTLLWKNVIIKKRHPIKWALEVLLPVALILLMGYLKTLTNDVVVPDGWANDDVADKDGKNGTSYSLFATDSISNIPFPKYYQTEGTMSGLLMQMATKTWNQRTDAALLSTEQNATCAAASFAGNVSTDANSPNAWPVQCRDKIVPYKLAIAPDNDFTRKYFLQTITKWYPRVPLDPNQTLVVPALADSVMFFKDESALNAYVISGSYGKGFDTPKVSAAIVFTTVPSTLGTVGDIQYSLRLNSTLGRGGATGDIPRTNLKAYNPLQRSITTDSYTRYAKSGFMTYQTLVTRFALCVPDWDAQSSSTSGNCTQDKSVMAGNVVSDIKLVSTQLQADVNALLTVAAYMKATQKQFNFNAVPLSSLSALAAPLRQMPQPVGGAAVFAFPIQSFTSSPFFNQVKDFFGLVFVISYLHALSSVLVALITEKETKARELMKILGVHESAIVLSWYITYGLVFITAAILQAVA
ncbi:hypothetical protein As57867_003061, partial [Aphanomyces stellatus]